MMVFLLELFSIIELEVEQGTFHLINPKHRDTEDKEKVDLCPSLCSEGSVTPIAWDGTIACIVTSLGKE